MQCPGSFFPQSSTLPTAEASEYTVVVRVLSHPHTLTHTFLFFCSVSIIGLMRQGPSDICEHLTFVRALINTVLYSTSSVSSLSLC
jgi:hypothetical protein